MYNDYAERNTKKQDIITKNESIYSEVNIYARKKNNNNKYN